MQLGSRRRIRRPGTGSLVCSPDLFHGGAEPLSQFLCDIFTQPRVPSLDGSQCSRGHTDLFRQLRLRQASENSQVTEVPLIPRDENNVIHCDAQNRNNPVKVVNLRGGFPHFPAQNSRGTHLRESSELPSGEFFRHTCSFQRSGRKTPQDSSAHSSHPRMSHHFA